MKRLRWLFVLVLLLGAVSACIPPELQPPLEEEIVEPVEEEPAEEVPVEEPVAEEPEPEEPTPTDTATPTATAEASATSTATPTATAPPVVYGGWNIVTSYFEGDQEHVIYIMLPEETTLDVREGSIIFDGEGTWVDVTGELQPDGSFEAEGTGTVAGFPDILVTFTGTITADTLEGHYTMGADGKLPGGKSVTYLVEGTRQE